MVYGYEGLSMHPPSPDYVPEPEHPPYPDYVPDPEHPPSPEFVSEPVYPEFMPPKDDVLLVEEQPLPAAISPTTDSPGYITESDPKEDPKEDDKDPKEDPEEDEDEKEEEHPALTDSIPPPPVHHTTARISISAQAHVPFLSEAEVERLLALPTPPPSPLTSYSSPLPHIPSPPLPASPTYTLGYQAVMIRLRAESLSTSHPLPLPPSIVLPYTRASMAMMRAATPSTYILAPRSETPPSGTPPLLAIPLHTSSPSLLLPSINCKACVLEFTLPPRKRLCIALGLRFKVEECSFAPTARPTGGFRADYGFVGTLDAEIRQLGQRMTYFVTTVRQDTDEIYVRLNDAHDDRLLMSGQLNSLRRDRHAHARTTRLMESETTVLTQQNKIRELRAADRRRQIQLAEALTLLKTLQTQTAALQSQQRPAKDPTHPDKKMTLKRTTRSSPATTTTTTNPVTNAQLKALINQGVAYALAARDVDRSRNGKDSHDSGTGIRRQAPLAREFTYPDFMKYKPLYFKGTEGVIELTQWFERMETVFRISNCNVENQIKFATCTLFRSALTWWNSHIKTVGHNVAYVMTCINLKKKMTDKYCPRGEIKKLEELALMCARMFLEESYKIERYVSGFPDMIHESVMVSKPKTMQDVIEFTTELMDKKISTITERQAENKRKFEDTSKNNQNQQQNKRQNTGRAYTVGSGEKKPYRVGHLARDCRSPTNANTANNQRGIGPGQKATCFECRAQGHFKRECPKLKNNNHDNQGGNGNALAKVYAVGHAETNPDSNVVTGTFLLNNRYASILFDTGADRSFVSTAFSSQIDIAPTILDHYYDVELADRRIVGLNNIIQGCTLNFLNHPFNINLMPIELGSFSVIIGEKNQEKDKIGSKPDKKGKRGEAGKSLKQLQWVEQEKLSKTQKE
nr:hypothetical protein [Tanacetum cinerariifolium]